MAASVTVFPAREGPERPPRVLIGTVVEESRMGAFEQWTAAVRSQRTHLLWDLALVDGTDDPSPWYLKWLVAWSKSHPFGASHRVRLLRVGVSEGEVFRDDEVKARCARRLLWAKVERWQSYEYLLTLDLEVMISPDALERLVFADTSWATAGPGLSCSLFRRAFIEDVPLKMTTAPEAEQLAHDAREAGLVAVRVPAAR